MPDQTRDIPPNTAFRLREFPRAKAKETPKEGVLYFTVYPNVSPNAGSISFLRNIMLMIPLIISLTISLYTP